MAMGSTTMHLAEARAQIAYKIYGKNQFDVFSSWQTACENYITKKQQQKLNQSRHITQEHSNITQTSPFTIAINM